MEVYNEEIDQYLTSNNRYDINHGMFFYQRGNAKRTNRNNQGVP